MKNKELATARSCTLLLFFIFAVFANAQVEPLVKTAWHQRSPYNQYCPDNTLAGCVAIAMAQVMNYHKYPEHGIGKNTYLWKGKKLSADFGSTYYRWDEMDSKDGTAAAELIYQCGVSVWMDYSTSFSGSSEYYAKSSLCDFFGYSEDIKMVPRNKYTDSEWADILREQIDKGWPMIYSSGGHTFIVDGYNAEGKFHANMGFGNLDAKRYMTIDELGSKASSTALINIHPATDATSILEAAYTPVSPRSAAIKKTIRNGKIIIVKGDAAYDLDGKKH